MVCIHIDIFTFYLELNFCDFLQACDLICNFKPAMILQDATVELKLIQGFYRKNERRLRAVTVSEENNSNNTALNYYNHFQVSIFIN